MSTRPSQTMLAALTFALLAACNDNTPPPRPGSFDRPNRVAFACVKQGSRIVPLADCEDYDAEAEETDDYRMHALVTQSTRGEVAGVDLEDGAILDGREDIPGFTFASVGELPVAVVVPEQNPAVTYVANFGSRDITLLDTRKLLAGEGTDDAAIGDAVPVEHMGMRGAPVDMVLSPEEDALYVAVPELAQVLRFPIERCAGGDDGAEDCEDGSLGAAIAIDLSGSSAQLVTTMPEDGAGDESYAELCGYQRGVPSPAPALDIGDDVLMARPRPRAMALDDFCEAGSSCTRRLLVADETLPLIHAIDLDAAPGADALLEPIAVGVPTLDVAVTPRVPITTDGQGETQFVYAIDAHDGSVIVTENGRVLSVNADPSFRSDRVWLDGIGSDAPASAAVLEILTPAFDVHGPADQFTAPTPAAKKDSNGKLKTIPASDDYCTDEEGHETQDPRRLRGVFLAVAMSDGTVRIVDVHDNELRECRRCANRPTVAVTSVDDGVVEVAPNADWQPMPGDTVRYGDAETIVASATLDNRFTPADAVFNGGVPSLEVDAPPAIPVLLRHHPRLRDNFIDDDPSQRPSLTPVVQTLAFRVGSASFTVRNNGDVGSPQAPGLECLGCDRDLAQVFPDPDDQFEDEGQDEDDAGVVFSRACPIEAPGLVCVEADPWTAIDELWTFWYEGPLDGSRGAQGLFRGMDAPDSYTHKRIEFVAETGFCGAGVLGDEDAAGAREGVDCEFDPAAECSDAPGGCPEIPEALGDQLVILSRPPGSARLKELALSRGKPLSESQLARCEKLARDLEDAEAKHILAFPIEKAFDGFLILTGSGALLKSIGEVKTWEDVDDCMGGAPVSYEVRTRDSFAVYSATSGMAHRVVEHESGRCHVDSELDAHQQGRAWKGCTFRNRTLQLRPRYDEDAVATPRDVQLRARVESPAGMLVLRGNTAGFSSTTVVPVQLHYNRVDGRLYLVDIHRRGLVPISLDPFRETVSFSFN